MRIVFVPPIPLSAFPFKEFTIYVTRYSYDYLKYLIKHLMERGYTVESYIRHESTARVLSGWLGTEIKPSNALYEYRDGDVIIVVGLRKPQRGKEVEVASIEDLDLAVVTVKKGM